VNDSWTHMGCLLIKLAYMRVTLARAVTVAPLTCALAQVACCAGVHGCCQ
jgi:hypothetical protein